MEYRVIRSGYEDELYHHKYVSRKKGKNGKWIYTYPKDVTEVSNMTGMEEKYVNEAKKLGSKHGFESAEYKDAVSVLSEGDADMAKRITDIFKKSSLSSTASKKGQNALSNILVRRKDSKTTSATRPRGRERNVTGSGKSIYRREK